MLQSLVFEESTLNYETLNMQANQFANYLIKLGANSQTCVGIAIHRSPDLLISLLGILKVGCTFVPLDTYQPKERLDHITLNSQAQMIAVDKMSSSSFKTIVVN